MGGIITEPWVQQSAFRGKNLLSCRGYYVENIDAGMGNVLLFCIKQSGSKALKSPCQLSEYRSTNKQKELSLILSSEIPI